MNTIGKEGYWPIVQGLRLGPNDGEEPGTAEFHHQITDAVLPQTDAVFDDAAALDTAIDVLDPEPSLVERLVGELLLPGQLLAAWLLGRHEDRHLRERERQEAEILQ